VGRLDGKVLKEESAKGGGENKGEEEEEKMKVGDFSLWVTRFTRVDKELGTTSTTTTYIIVACVRSMTVILCSL
jgi:hypothetical protein